MSAVTEILEIWKASNEEVVKVGTLFNGGRCRILCSSADCEVKTPRWATVGAERMSGKTRILLDEGDGEYQEIDARMPVLVEKN